VAESCPSAYPEEWDLKGLIDGVTQYYPTRFSVEDLSQAATTDDLVESIVEEALEYYEKHAESMPGGTETMRQIERQVMLQILDDRWRDHLAEMDNLKDGIHLRWTVQADPLNAWQSEGYNLFGQLMEGGVTDLGPASELRQPFSGGGDGLRVPVQPEDAQVGMGLEDGTGVTAAADGGVDDDTRRHRREQRHHLRFHDRLVLEHLAHPQPLDWRNAVGRVAPATRLEAGGGGVFHRTSRGAAHVPGVRVL